MLIYSKCRVQEQCAGESYAWEGQVKVVPNDVVRYIVS